VKNSAKRHSKLLSLILRHAPEKAGLELGAGGWVLVADLLSGLDRIGSPMTQAELENLVATNEKKRFTLSDDGSKIRAAQGHSVSVDMEFSPTQPPAELFHGTATRTLPIILAGGLKPMSRQHVHLSVDHETAVRVGQRHGKPVVLKVLAGALHQSGQDFYQAENGVWLTGNILPQYIQEAD